MKKISALLLAGVMAATALAGCGGSNSASGQNSQSAENDWTYIQNKGELVIGITYFEPMNYMDENGNLTGFETEFATKVCEKMGVTPKFQKIDWDSKEVEPNAKTIDCIWNGFTINGREDDYTWSDPYLNNEQVMVVAADSGIEKLDDLAGKNVVVQAASAALDALNSDDNKDLTASFASLTENPDYNTAFMNLDSGAADAIAVDIGVAKYQLSQREEGKYVILDEPIQSEQYGIGFKKGNDELKDTVWEEVLKLYDAGEVDKLAEKYEVADMLCIGDDEKSDDKKDDAAEDDASDADTAKEDTADTAKDAE